MFLRSRRQQRVVRIGVWVAVLGLLLGVLSSIIMATAADAHTELKSVDPADGSRVTSPPARVVLTFTEPVGTSFATVIVTGPEGAVSRGRAAVDGAVVTQQLDAGIPFGDYTVAFRVVSEDGHPVSARTTFTVAANTPTPASSTTTSTASTTTDAGSPTRTSKPVPTGVPTSSVGQSATADDSRGVRIALAVAVGALALAAGTAVIALSRRRGPE